MTHTNGFLVSSLLQQAKHLNFIAGYMDAHADYDMQEKGNLDEEYSNGYNYYNRCKEFSEIEDTMYYILDGDGVNQVYGSEGMWYFPDGSFRDDGEHR